MSDENGNGKRFLTLNKVLAIAGAIISIAVTLLILLGGGWAQKV